MKLTKELTTYIESETKRRAEKIFDKVKKDFSKKYNEICKGCEEKISNITNEFLEKINTELNNYLNSIDLGNYNPDEFEVKLCSRQFNIEARTLPKAFYNINSYSEFQRLAREVEVEISLSKKEITVDEITKVIDMRIMEWLKEEIPDIEKYLN